MPLTPADVHNVAFKKPPIGKRGYDEEEVDAFLDEVERELARLIEENNELRAQVERGGRGGAPAGPGGDARLAAELNDVKAQLDRVQRDKAAAEQAARAMQAELEQVRSVGVGGAVAGPDGEQQALRVLMMAQRTADDHVSDARREADQLLSEARSKAEEVTREARAKADALERDARQRHQEAMGGLDAKRTALQKHIEELKQFEREYRTRLKAYLESQLRDLDGRGQGLEAEMTRGEGARAAGNGLAAAGLAGSYGGGRSGALEAGR
ncbi:MULTISPECIES: DivIVA domain-containing protein [Micromonospora]|uniref:Cell wall synthesis protein Wag31 n=2 Tax=Micromonospora TaxID=1873 RepID=A0A9W5UPC3_9ACTN|nr:MULTISPECIES: DivIVA domain-containing protein [Micromonospora]MCZ7418100.1 DivIVA domain-containing protein [Verrucosispora sp. WMMA2121]WBB91855.1 DivIVA domain-containing protein [Verrucosispora sp. WMMC514]WFE47281.1 DivIVA domain-containing protein [Verrucosispora sp. WMMD1129]SFB77226.1 DivIVA domain-containing protein [Micromonospora sediminimaris]GIJ12455.1 cell wall synthesis protein Wag31 [Micromonospora andamanensis]